MTAVFLIFAGFAIFVPAASAAAPPWSAQEMIRSARSLQLAPGASATFTIGFKNTGTRTWTAEGANFVSVYTFDPKYRQSDFADVSWLNDKQPARLSEAAVAPGRIGRVSFTLFAPLQPGKYVETFALAAESLAWIPGGKFSVNIEVRAPAPPAAVGTLASVNLTQPAADRPPAASGYKAEKLLVSARELNLAGGATQTFRVGFKNVGRVAWRRDGQAPLALMAAPGNAYSFRHSSWQQEAVARLSAGEVKPGGLALMDFTVSAPNISGLYLARFVLEAGGQEIEGGEIEIPIQVTSGGAPSAVPPAYDPALSVSGPRGPDLRIGLYYTTRPVTIYGAGQYALIDGDGRQVAQLSGSTTTTFDFSARRYTVRNGDFVYYADKHVRFQPADPAATIFEITSLENRPTWDPTVNFNRFRGALEVYYTKATDRLWVIEELPAEDYLRGLAETSNGSPYEYQKALITAARTYALFVKAIGGKHQSEYFDLNTTGNDQVYKGYSSELIRPNVVRAAQETRGQVVTYGGEIVVTPYFSSSDGRTRAWTEVWGGSASAHPWLVSRPAPYDQGEPLSGHGVGLSANDAIGRANAGAAWTDILKYYYTGIDLKSLY